MLVSNLSQLDSLAKMFNREKNRSPVFFWPFPVFRRRSPLSPFQGGNPEEFDLACGQGPIWPEHHPITKLCPSPFASWDTPQTLKHIRERICAKVFPAQQRVIWPPGVEIGRNSNPVAVPCVQLCNTSQYHTIPRNTTQYHTIPCNTTKYHAIREECKSCPKCTSIYCHLPPATPFSTN